MMRHHIFLRGTALFAVALSILGTASFFSRSTPADAQTYNLIWADDFNGAVGSSPDGSKWGFETGGGGYGNSELEDYTSSTNNAYITSDSAAQDGKALVIKAIKQNDGNNCWYGACQYTSARMNTSGKFTVQYGRIEARAKMPIGKGMWPAFWMLGDNIGSVGWPQSGEIDIMETIGTDITNNHGSIHGPGYSGGSDRTATYTLPGGAQFSDAYHTFRIDWSPNQIQWFVDGNLYETRTPADVSPNQWAFNHPFFLIMNLAVGGTWPGSPDGSTVFPQELRFDYVHVYQLGTASGDGTPFSGSAYAIPGKVETENYNNGGEGAAYHDSDATNNGGQYRPNDGVDIEATTDTGGGYDVGWTAAGEWTKYTVNVASSGSYAFDFRVASAQTGGAFHLEVDNVNVTGSLTVPNTGGWQTWTNVTKTGVSLSAGQHVFKLVTDAAGGNYNWFNVTSNGPTPTFVPPTATPSSGGSISPTTWYQVVNQGNGLCIDDQNGNAANGAVVQQWACATGNTNQRWQFRPTSSGYYEVVSYKDVNAVWDVTNVSTADSALIQLWQYGGGNNQQWQPVALDSTHYKFVNRNSGKCLDVPSASTANGVQLQQYTCNGTGAQAWSLVP
jgi:beta-glucanase (GH16 family)